MKKKILTAAILCMAAMILTACGDKGLDAAYEEFTKENKVDYFVFGHYHSEVVDMKLPSGASLNLLKDWIDGSPYMYFDGISITGGSFQKSEK